MGSMGLGRWALADGPWPIGLGDPPWGYISGPEDPPMGVYFRARGRWGPMGSMGLGDPPWAPCQTSIRALFYYILIFVPILILFLNLILIIGLILILT